MFPGFLGGMIGTLFVLDLLEVHDTNWLLLFAAYLATSFVIQVVTKARERLRSELVPSTVKYAPRSSRQRT